MVTELQTKCRGRLSGSGLAGVDTRVDGTYASLISSSGARARDQRLDKKSLCIYPGFDVPCLLYCTTLMLDAFGV
jgi:hypothetical protein